MRIKFTPNQTLTCAGPGEIVAVGGEALLLPRAGFGFVCLQTWQQLHELQQGAAALTAGFGSCPFAAFWGKSWRVWGSVSHLWLEGVSYSGWLRSKWKTIIW